jgi:PAS domain S-box-containing protein
MPRLLGIVCTLVAIALMDALNHSTLRLPISVLYVTMIYAGFIGGTGGGMISAALGVVYAAYFFSAGHPFQFEGETAIRFWGFAITAPAMVLLLGYLRNKTNRLSQRLLRLELDRSASEIERATQMFEASEQQYRKLADAMPLLLWRTDERGTNDYCNAEWFRYTGLNQEQSFQPDVWMRVMHPDDQLACAEHWRQSYVRGETFEMECRYRAADGSYRWHLARVVPMHDLNDQVIRWLGTAADIDDQKCTQAELQGAKETAEAADRAKDQFLAVLSHELRTPLTPVLATVTALKKQADLPADVRESIEMMHRNIELEARLIDDLLDLTRIARGKLPLEMETTDVHALIQHVIDICGEEIVRQQMHLRVDLQAAEHHVQGDPARLQQVFWNLIKNAVKYTDEGGEVRISSTHRDGMLEVTVADNGIGIDAETLPRIFYAFEQGDHTGSRRFGGLGLGLTISKSLIDKHLGRLRASSEGVGKGSAFTVELRTVPAPAPVVSTPSVDSVDPIQRKLKILMVEDHLDTSRALQRLLSGMGYDVSSASTVESAIREAQATRFDLLISDIGLPDGSGLDLIRRLLAERPIKGIALSGYGMEEDVVRSKEAGFTEHLTKPINLQKLEATIQRVAEGGA